MGQGMRMGGVRRSMSGVQGVRRVRRGMRMEAEGEWGECWIGWSEEEWKQGRMECGGRYSRRSGFHPPHTRPALSTRQKARISTPPTAHTHKDTAEGQPSLFTSRRSARIWQHHK